MPLTSSPVRFGSFELDLQSGELRKNGLQIRLADQPLQILTLLLEHPGQVVTREELRQRLWSSETFVDFDHSLNAAVKRLREGLGDSADIPRFIETIPRHGYRLIVSEHSTNAAERKSAQAESVLTSSRPRAWWTSAIIVTAIAALLLISYARRKIGTTSAYPPNFIHSVAVLPLEYLSNDPSQEYFSDGMTEALITELGRIRALRVISRQSVMRYKGTTKTVQQIAKELQVDALVEGSTLRDGSKVRITIQFIRVSPEEHLWAQTYEREIRDVLALQAEVAQAIVAELQTQLTPDEQARLAKTHPVNAAAYDAYLQGSYELNKWGPQMAEAVQHFKQAIAADPGYAPAYVGLSYTYIALPFFTATPPEEAYAKAQAMASRALELDPEYAEAYTVLARTRAQYFDWSGADSAYRRAIDLNPGSAAIHTRYGWFLAWVGRFDQALQEQRIALDRDPFNLYAMRAIGMILYFQHQPDQALDQFRRALQLDPNNVVLNGDLGRAYLQKGMYTEAISQLEKSRTLAGGETGGSATGGGYLGFAYALAGERSKAIAILHGLQDRWKHSYASPSNIAMIYLGLGDKERALDWLRTGLEVGDGDIVVLKTSPVWEPLHSDLRFQELLRRMNFPP
jgi:TolB-like protein/DNA-binding winged helix-turn-helix (wHTH) protein/Flp pilus assembly protein TadD